MNKVRTYICCACREEESPTIKVRRFLFLTNSGHNKNLPEGRFYYFYGRLSMGSTGNPARLQIEAFFVRLTHGKCLARKSSVTDYCTEKIMF